MVNAGTNAVHFPAYDLNGNVMGLVNATNGIISAKYEYGPFGEVFCSVGDMAKVNPFQFSTKYTDNETDLVYYGYRYYSPALGRWLSRDPIEEKGGLNLYGFVNNDPVNGYDVLGMWGNNLHEVLTRRWALRKHYPYRAAKIIAKANDAVDGSWGGFVGETAPVPWGDQSYHFNRNLNGGFDSRLEHFESHLSIAKKYCNGRWERNWEQPSLAAQELGTALHPLQDWVAHGDYGMSSLSTIFWIHNTFSPQKEFGENEDYPDRLDLDAIGSPDGRPAGAAIHFHGGSVIDYAIYKKGKNRFNLTKEKTEKVLDDFLKHVDENGGCRCLIFFGRI